MRRTVRVLGLVLVAAMLGACATAPPVQPTAREGYAFTITVQPHPTGSAVTVQVDPPDPSDPAQRAIAQRLREDFIRAFQAQMPLPTPEPL